MMKYRCIWLLILCVVCISSFTKQPNANNTDRRNNDNKPAKEHDSVEVLKELADAKHTHSNDLLDSKTKGDKVNNKVNVGNVDSKNKRSVGKKRKNVTKMSKKYVKSKVGKNSSKNEIQTSKVRKRKKSINNIRRRKKTKKLSDKKAKGDNKVVSHAKRKRRTLRHHISHDTKSNDDKNQQSLKSNDEESSNNNGDDSDYRNCPRGYTLDIHSLMCRPCVPGTYYDSILKICKDCPAGRFSSKPASLSCASCDQGEISHKGESQCVLCSSGSVASETHDRCIQCLPGTWSVSGDKTCRRCYPGTFNDRTGAAGCIDCGKGRYNAKFGSTKESTCIDCPQGTMCPKTATVVPIVCKEQFFSPKASHVCLSCPAMFVSSPGRDNCVPTGIFYVIVFIVIVISILGLIWLLNCPKKQWHFEI